MSSAVSNCKYTTLFNIHKINFPMDEKIEIIIKTITEVIYT